MTLRRAAALILAFASPLAAECVPGTTLVNNEKDPARVAVGRESFPRARDLREIQLAGKPDWKDNQVYLVAQSDLFLFGVAPLVQSSWCYDAETNSIRFKETPLKAVPLFSDKPVEVPSDAVLWAGYYSEAERNPDCIQGLYLNYLKGGEDGHTYGQKYFAYDQSQDTVGLDVPARSDRQMYLYDGMWVYGYDWCYAPEERQVKFLRSPARLYTAGGLPGREISKGEIVWAGYVPETEGLAKAGGPPLPPDPDGKMLLKPAPRKAKRPQAAAVDLSRFEKLEEHSRAVAELLSSGR